MGKRIGLLTFHFPQHVGAVIQAYSLKTLVERLGLSVEIINYIPPWHSLGFDNPLLMLKKHMFLYRKFSVNDNYVTKLFSIFRNVLGVYIRNIFDLQSLLIDEYLYRDFLRKQLQVRAQAVTELQALKRIISMYDVIIVGSDQVWNPDFLRGAEFAYLLPFKVPGVRKVAFSASIGSIVKLLRDERLKRLFRYCLMDFTFVSVRERQHATILEKLVGRSVYHTLDPVLLVDKSTLEGIARKPEHIEPDISEENYIIIYNLDDSTLPRAFQLVKESSLPAIVYKVSSTMSLVRYIQFCRHRKCLLARFRGPREIVWLIRNATMIVTNSYHGLLLSIVFQKPVVFVMSGVASATPDRITDIIYHINAKNRIINFRDWWCLYLNEVAVKEARQLLKPFRERSIKLLKEVLKDQSGDRD